MIEEAIAERYARVPQPMRCPVHLSIGQEFCAVGVAEALSPGDRMVSTHRSHAHYLARGGDLKAMIAELYGKASGCSGGHGGSMHLCDRSVGFYGSTSIVAGTVPVGVGLAFADKIRGDNRLTVICIGDAVVEEGVFHEAANFAALHKLRVLFVCENNQFSCFTHLDQRQPTRDRSLSEVAKSHGMHYIYAPYELTKIRARAQEAVEIIHEESYPTFLELQTWRLREHCGPASDDHLGYRDAETVQQCLENDPLRGLHDDAVAAEIAEAFRLAERAELPQEIDQYAKS